MSRFTPSEIARPHRLELGERVERQRAHAHGGERLVELREIGDADHVAGKVRIRQRKAQRGLRRRAIGIAERRRIAAARLSSEARSAPGNMTYSRP